MGVRKLLLLFLLSLSLVSAQETDPTVTSEPTGAETTGSEPPADPQPTGPNTEEPAPPSEPEPPAEPVVSQPAEQPPAEPVPEGAPSTAAEPTNPPPAQPPSPPTTESSECEDCEGCCDQGKCLTPEECEKRGIEVQWVKGVPNWATVLACIGLFLLLTMLVSLILKYCCTKKDVIEDEWLRERLISEAIPKYAMKEEVWK